MLIFVLWTPAGASHHLCKTLRLAWRYFVFPLVVLHRRYGIHVFQSSMSAILFRISVVSFFLNFLAWSYRYSITEFFVPLNLLWSFSWEGGSPQGPRLPGVYLRDLLRLTFELISGIISEQAAVFRSHDNRVLNIWKIVTPRSIRFHSTAGFSSFPPPRSCIISPARKNDSRLFFFLRVGNKMMRDSTRKKAKWIMEHKRHGNNLKLFTFRRTAARRRRAFPFIST